MMLLLLSSALLLMTANVGAETCPGGRVRCPDFMTCCQVSGDEFGCCPFPDAKCCADHIHCCPHNMDCDVGHQSCVRNGSSVQFYWQVPIHPEMVEHILPEERSESPGKEVNDLRQFKENAGECPDKTKCISKFTCCKMYSGKYGCCPFENATCCHDGFHCCPHGSKCLATGECTSMEMNYTIKAYTMQDRKYDEQLMVEQASRKSNHLEVSDPGGLCPDGHPCPEKYTCCKIKGKRYGCCPYTDATCCDDGIQCCPKGTTCNTTLGTCDIQKNHGLFILRHPVETITSNRMREIVSDVICPDERYHCPTGSTCCALVDGTYGCCPLEKATCCSDKAHCCPYGYSCVSDGCKKGTSHLPPFLWTAATERTPIEEQVEEETAEDRDLVGVSDVICPDKYPCPDRNTCCQLASEEYGCCPMEKATCCNDKIHCCPHGYRCISDGCRKESGFSTYSQFLNATMINVKHQAVKTPQVEMEVDHSVECPDKKSECPDGATCCQLVSGSYGCCPYENATCCGDQIHCCPHGYWCNDEGCDRMPGMPAHLAPFLQKLFSTRKVNDHSRTVPLRLH